MPDFAGMEEGNWPTSCRKELRVAFDMDVRRSGGDGVSLKALWEEALNNWNDPLDCVMTVDESADALRTAHIWARDKALPGGTLAWSFLANGSCHSRMEQAYDNTITWSDLLLLTTITHEVGHALGFPHNGDSTATMYPNINSAAQRRRGKPNKTDLDIAVRNGYKLEPGSPDGPGDPDDPDSPGPLFEIIEGRLAVKLNGDMKKGQKIFLMVSEASGL